MRKYKFRAKLLDNSEWVYGDLLHPFTQTRIVNYDEREIESGRRADFFYHDVEESTVGQFTGLTDKNGKEIYEGDIVRYYDDLEDDLMTGEVRYAEDFCSFNVVSDKRDPFPLSCFWQFEIIGNIHDNSDLLTDKLNKL